MTLFKGLRAQRLLLLFVVASVLLSYPLLSLWPQGPWALPVAAFACWLAVIVMLAWLNERGSRARSETHRPGRDW